MSQALLELPPMAASRSVKIDGDLLKKIKIITDASDGEVKIQDYINQVLTPAVARDYPKALKKLNDAEKENGK